MRKQPTAQLKDVGFTLMEVAVAGAVLAIFFASIAVITQMVLGLIGESRIRAVSANLAQARMERVRNLAYASVGTMGGIPAGPIAQQEIVNINGQNFEVRTSVVYIDDPFDGVAPGDSLSTDYKRVKVAVSWDGPFASKNPLVVVTDVAPRGTEAEEVGGVLQIKVINALGDPVEGASVFIVNDAVIPAINIETTTNVQGGVVLPGSPICNVCYQIRVEKSGYSSDKTYSSGEVANPSKPYSTILDGEVSQVTLAVDRVGSIQVRTTGSRAANYPAFSGVAFILRGNKIIGTNTLDENVYKYEKNLTSGPGGLLNVANLEWDTYSVSIPVASSVDLAGSIPINPFSLLPGGSVNLWVVTSAASANSMLVVVKDASGNPLADTSVKLLTPSGGVLNGVAGAVGKGDTGQVLFSNLAVGEYGVTATKSGYLQASSSAIVNGDITEVTVLEQ